MISNLLTCLCILLGVAFYTLLERKVLSYIQNRKGPKMIGVMGMLQPISDAVKLFTKEMITPNMSNFLAFWMAPTLAFALAMMFWVIYPNTHSIVFSNFSILMFLVLSSLNVFGTMLSGWASNSKYSFLGAMRAMAQTISYEVSFVLLMFVCIFLLNTWSMEESKFGYPIVFILVTVFMMFMSSVIAETNRAPFDFAEGESELVSGFNIEYGGGSFVLLFLAEYANILFMSVISCALFFYSSNLFSFSMLVTGMSFVFLFTRGAYPRMRYDLLMNLCWKCYLPVSLLALLMVMPLM
uniref:NADH-ubiquinone oxidoreductase chain 1 n=1 Tax=Physa fontinalis TaxID=146087 RepID=A0A7D6ZUC8_9GAST|nr:NADH dehydrogenase subunit 1 [Physa fontinalis]